MCGLVGVIGTSLSTTDVKILKQLIYVDSLRGHHSTGLCVVDKEGEVDHYKKAVDGPDFLHLPTTQMLLSQESVVMFAHNRWATKGGVSNETAHPFEWGHITLMHNGTLTSQYGLPEHTSFPVDSENIAYAFYKDGAKATIPKLKGAFALAWYDWKEKTFNLVRNEERPLCLAAHKERGVVYYASERKMLEAILDRTSVHDKVDYVELEVGTWLKFPVEGGKVKKATSTTIEVSAPMKTLWSAPKEQKGKKKGGGGFGLGLKKGDVVEMYVAAVEPYSSSSINGRMHGTSVDGKRISFVAFNQSVGCVAGIYKASVVRLDGSTVVVENPKLVEVHEGDVHNKGKEKAVEKLTSKKPKALQVVGPEGKMVSVDQFNSLVAGGCHDCGSGIDEDEASSITWMVDEEEQFVPVCYYCTHWGNSVDDYYDQLGEKF